MGVGEGVSAQSRASCRRKQKACRLGNDTLAFQACLDYTVKKGCTSLCKKEKNKQKRKQCEKLAKRVLKRGGFEECLDAGCDPVTCKSGEGPEMDFRNKCLAKKSGYNLKKHCEKYVTDCFFGGTPHSGYLCGGIRYDDRCKANKHCLWEREDCVKLDDAAQNCPNYEETIEEYKPCMCGYEGKKKTYYYLYDNACKAARSGCMSECHPVPDWACPGLKRVECKKGDQLKEFRNECLAEREGYGEREPSTSGVICPQNRDPYVCPDRIIYGNKCKTRRGLWDHKEDCVPVSEKEEPVPLPWL